MTEDTDTTDEEPITEQSDAVTLAASTTYKILGELDADDGTGVLGRNTADSGTPIGVEGAVPNNSDGYGLSTPDDARVDGWLETPTVAIQSSGSFIDASGNSHLTINDGGPLGVDRMLDLSGNDISNASTVTATTTNTDSLAPNTSSSVTLAGPLDANSNDIINVGTVDCRRHSSWIPAQSRWRGRVVDRDAGRYLGRGQCGRNCQRVR